MSENTKNAWATHTFNPWIGCSKVHAGCTNCYAEAMAGRLGVKWGPNGTRRRTAESTWKQVERWSRQAACTCGRDSSWAEKHVPACPQADRPRVFPSLCDPFEDWDGDILDSGGDAILQPSGLRGITMADVRHDFFALIDRCPNLDFLLLTKRPENLRRIWPAMCDSFKWQRNIESGDSQRYRRNVWLLYSASDHESLWRGYGSIQACRDLCKHWGLSLEPLGGPVNLGMAGMDGNLKPSWIIVGGESGPRHRPMEIAWLESIAEQCEAAGVPLFVKQDCGPKAGQQGRIPDHLWTRKEFPRVSK